MLSGRYRKGVIQGWIIAIAALAIALVMILIGYQLVEGIGFPGDKELNVVGSKTEVVSQLSSLVKRCWRNQDSGDSPTSADCYLVFINSSEDIKEQDILDTFLDKNLKSQFSSVDIAGGKLYRLKISYSGGSGNISVTGFRQLLNGVCESELGETCLYPDCRNECVSKICLPGYGPSKVDQIGCVLPEFIGVLGEGQMCQYLWECSDPLNCGFTINFNGFEKACCPEGKGWNGGACVELKDVGEECVNTNECKENLGCNSVSPGFSNYPAACCSGGQHWNGSSCVFLEGESCSPLECDQGLLCSPQHPNSTGSGNVCCSSGTRWNGEECQAIKTYDVYFVPQPDSYGSDSKYEERAERYKVSILDKTPFQECVGIVTFKTLKSRSEIDGKQDLLVFVTNSRECNAFSSGGQGTVTIHAGLGDNEIQDMVVPHEMGHEFGLCDEYLSESAFYAQSRLLTVGECGNPWPGDKGWRPMRQCTGVGGSSGAGSCGMDIDGDPNTRASSLMGGGGGFKMPCGSGLVIDQPQIAPGGYDAFKEEIKRRGFTC